MTEINVYLTFTGREYFALSCVIWALHEIFMKALELYAKRREDRTVTLPMFLSCNKCAAFWFVLLTTFQIFDAAICAFTVCLISSSLAFLSSNSSIKL